MTVLSALARQTPVCAVVIKEFVFGGYVSDVQASDFGDKIGKEFLGSAELRGTLRTIK